ncbi:MAG TPA: hypothetical protein VNQ33_12645 [Acidimicrobiales bacterium]|nr:hypothetical protein [Acidimicrobiales bacterium]
MNRLDDAFEALIAQHPEGDPDMVIATARQAAATSRARHRTVLALASAAAVVVVAAASAFAVAGTGEPASQIHAGPGLTATTAVTTPDTPATKGSGHAIASPAGVALRSGTDPATDLPITGEPAVAAYAVGTELVVYQGADPDPGDQAWPWPAGDIAVWSRHGTKTVAIPDGTDRAELLDAGTVDGSPKALVALYHGDGFDTSSVTLALIDLHTLSSHTVVDHPAWESGYTQARVLPDGDVIGLLTVEASSSLVRWTPGRPDAVWSTPAPDLDRTLALRGDRAVLIDTQQPGKVTTYPVDLATGALGTPATTPTTGVDGDLSCRDWYDDQALSCARPTAPAGTIGSQGTWHQLPTPDGATVTASRD